MVTSYLFSRRDWNPDELDAPSLATHVFFQMWRTRMWPYNALADGDVVYIGDPATRRISWQVRISALLTDFRYDSTRQALNGLYAAYGLRAADLNDYHRQRTGHGWLLAWCPTVSRRVSAVLPAGSHFGQNGYRLLDDDEQRALGLPAPKRGRPLATPPPWYDPAAATSDVPRTVPRYIPLHVRRAVADRDGHRCVGCGATDSLHFDHVLPYSRGGPPTVDNLRLVCGSSNLHRGAGDPSGPLHCTATHDRS